MKVKTVETDKEMNDAFEMRSEVFVKEQQVPIERETDEHEDQSIHFIAYDGKFPIGAGRLRRMDQEGKVERVCVKQVYRNQGIGRMLMDYIEETAQKSDMKALLLNAQTHAELFYEKLGYKTCSKPFFEAGMPHVTMKKTF